MAKMCWRPIAISSPIKILRDCLIAEGILTQEALEIMDQEVRTQVNEAAETADAAPAPDPSELYSHVYSQINEHGRLFFDGRDR